MKIRVAGIQLRLRKAVTKKGKQKNIERAKKLIARIGSADLIVLPELFTIGYSRKTFQRLSELADTLHGETIDIFCDIAREKNTFIAFGFAEKWGEGYGNSVAVINNRGELVGVYRKMHLPNYHGSVENKFFIRGDRRFSFDLRGIKVGVINCYDIRFPELTRALALQDNIDLLIHPVAFNRDESYSTWHPFVITRAKENQIYIMSLNQAGERNGGSIFCPPHVGRKIKPVILGYQEGVIIGIVDTKVIAKTREEYHFRRDIREEY